MQLQKRKTLARETALLWHVHWANGGFYLCPDGFARLCWILGYLKKKKNAQFNSQPQWTRTNNIGRNKLTEQTYCNIARAEYPEIFMVAWTHYLEWACAVTIYTREWMLSFKAWLSAIG